MMANISGKSGRHDNALRKFRLVSPSSGFICCHPTPAVGCQAAYHWNGELFRFGPREFPNPCERPALVPLEL